jgi:lysozyme
VNADVFAPLTQNQYDALIAFAFNVGPDAFRTSDVLRAVNAGRPLQAAQALEQWRRADWEGQPQVIDALVRRRAAEKALFLTPPDGFIAVPGAVLPPLADRRDALRGDALDLVTPLDGDEAAPRDATAEPDLMAGAASASAVQAADAVTDRLRALFPDEPAAPLPARGRGLAVDADPRPQAFPAPNLEGDPTLSLAPPSPAADPVSALQVDAEAEPLLLESQAVDEDERLDLTPVPEPEAPPAPEQRWPYFLLFIGGVVLFVAGVSASMHPDQPALFGWALGAAGIACLAAATYYLLKRMDED